jgi:hypothetical protein
MPCDLRFGSKPGEELIVGEDYVSPIKEKMDQIHDLVRRNMEETSDKLKENYDTRA